MSSTLSSNITIQTALIDSIEYIVKESSNTSLLNLFDLFKEVQNSSLSPDERDQHREDFIKRCQPLLNKFLSSNDMKASISLMFMRSNTAVCQCLDEQLLQHLKLASIFYHFNHPIPGDTLISGLEKLLETYTTDIEDISSMITSTKALKKHINPPSKHV